MQYKKGDKVRVKNFKQRPKHWASSGAMDYLMGKVTKVSRVYLDRICLDGEPWELKNEDVEPVKNECIVIYRKHNQVIALDKVTGEKAIAKCSPEDEFDFYTGAKLAFERLTGTPEIKYPRKLNAKICIVETYSPAFTEGKIYTINNGKITDNNGKMFPLGATFYSMEDVKDYFTKENDWKHVFPKHFSPFGLKFVEVVD